MPSFSYKYPQALLFKAALDLFIPQPMLIPELALIQVKDLALGIEPHEVRIDSLLELVFLDHLLVGPHCFLYKAMLIPVAPV